MLRDRLYLSVVGSHFVIDMFTGVCGVLLAVLSVSLGLSNAQVGTAITLYMLAGALSQPAFGWLFDRLPDTPGQARFDPLLLVSVSIAWMALFFSITAFTPVWELVVVMILLAALGSGLFHPIGTSFVASLRTSSANTSTALFFLGGQMGLALGPVLGGVLFDLWGRVGILPLCLLALAPAVMMWITVRQGQTVEMPAVTESKPDTTAQTVRRVAMVVLLAFVLLVALRSSVQATYQFLLPKLFADRGWDASIYGLLAGVYMGSAAVGNVIIGKLADRFGSRIVAMLSLLLSVPLGLLFLTTPSLLLIFATCAVVGVVTGGQHSILVVYAQRLLPVRKGLAAGLILGFTFASGALGTWLCGLAADTYGLQQAMQWVVMLGMPAALLALTLPGREVVAAPVVSTPQPAAR